MKQILALILAVLFALSAGGCAPAEVAAQDGVYHVVASFHPMLLLTRMVTDGVEGVEVSGMAETHTGCLHDYQLLSGDIRKLQTADLFVINGLGMETFLEPLTEQLPQLTVVDTGESIHEELEAACPEDHDHGEDHGHDGHDHSINGHVWMSVPYAMRQVEAICAALCAGDPAHAADYRANADAALTRMEELEAEVEDMLGACRGHAVSFHEGFDWYAEAYGLEILETLNLHEQDPGTRQMVELLHRMEDDGCAALLVEPYTHEPPSAAAMIARETGCPIVVIDPLTGGEADPEAYFTAMRANARALAEAMS